MLKWFTQIFELGSEGNACAICWNNNVDQEACFWSSEMTGLQPRKEKFQRQRMNNQILKAQLIWSLKVSAYVTSSEMTKQALMSQKASKLTTNSLSYWDSSSIMSCSLKDRFFDPGLQQDLALMLDRISIYHWLVDRWIDRWWAHHAICFVSVPWSLRYHAWLVNLCKQFYGKQQQFGKLQKHLQPWMCFISKTRRKEGRSLAPHRYSYWLESNDLSWSLA